MKKISRVLLISLMSGIIVFGLAQTLKAATIELDNPLKAKDIKELINTIINFIFWIAVAIAPLMVLVAAFYFLTAAGDPAKIKAGKDIILYTSIGLAIAMIAKGIASAIKQVMGF